MMVSITFDLLPPLCPMTAWIDGNCVNSMSQERKSL
jgi:hypothetical protein